MRAGPPGYRTPQQNDSNELVCTGWKASEDTVLTLTLTPCDEQGTSGEAGPEGLVVKAGLESPGVEVEGLVEEAGLEGGDITRSPMWRMKASWRRRVKYSYLQKGQTELLIDWEPCAACGKRWTPTWAPKESFV